MPKKPEARALAFAIHYLNPWGGQDRSTLEIIRRISQSIPVKIYCYDLNDPLYPDHWGKNQVYRLWPHLRRPALLFEVVYFLFTLGLLSLVPRLLRRTRPLVQSTGACSAVSDVIQVQFIQRTWHQFNAVHENEKFALYRRLLYRFNLWSEKLTFKPHKKYIAISKSIALELQTHFQIPKENINLIYHGVDSHLFRPSDSDHEATEDRLGIRNRLNIKGHESLLLFVGAYERKGLAPAIHAFSLLPPEIRNHSKFLALGAGNRARFETLAKSYGVEDRVFICPGVKDVERYYRAADVFLLPTTYEPFGLVILEALASGLPTLVSKNAGASELIDDGVSGLLLTNPQDEKEMTKKLAALLTSKDLRVTLGQNARQVAVKMNWDSVAQKYYQVLIQELK